MNKPTSKSITTYTATCFCGQKFKGVGLEEVHKYHKEHLKKCKLVNFIEDVIKIKPDITMKQIIEILSDDEDFVVCPRCQHEFLLPIKRKKRKTPQRKE